MRRWRGGEPRADAEHVEREFFDLFIGIGRGELLPYGSYYLTGFLNERPLARLRDDLARLGIERVEGEIEPEDHAAVLCEIMAGLAGGRFQAPAGRGPRAVRKTSGAWIGRFFADLEQREGGRLLSPNRNHRPGVHGDRKQGLCAGRDAARSKNRRCDQEWPQ